MRRRVPCSPFTGLAAAAALLVLAACDSDPTSPAATTAEPEIALAVSAAEAPAVSGSGHFRQDGQDRTFTFHAREDRNGAVSGRFHLRTGAGLDFDGQAVCMRTIGDEAWVGVERQKHGWSGGFRVRDDGEGGAADRISFVYTGFGSQAWCDLLPTWPALFEIDAGNVQVHAPNGPKPVPVYSEDFESGVGAEWSSSRLSTSPSGATYLGDFSDDEAHGVTLSLAGLPRHEELRVTFDMYVLRTMDGNDPTFGLDLFTFSEAGSGFQLQTTFSGFCGLQSFPLAFGEGEFFDCYGSSAVNSLGYEWFDGGAGELVPMDVTYPVTIMIPHAGATAELFFGAEGLQDFVDLAGDFTDESWGIDNVEVSVLVR